MRSQRLVSVIIRAEVVRSRLIWLSSDALLLTDILNIVKCAVSADLEVMFGRRADVNNPIVNQRSMHNWHGLMAVFGLTHRYARNNGRSLTDEYDCHWRARRLKEALFLANIIL